MCEANILCQSSSVRSAVPSNSTSPVVSRVRAMPAWLTRTSIVPKAAMKSANILRTAALLETSATKGRATPPARSISVTTFCADSVRTSLTPTLAPSRANSRPISRPSPEPPPVTSTILSFKRIESVPSPIFAGSRPVWSALQVAAAPLLRGAFGLGLFELTFPVEAASFGAGGFGFFYHALLLVEHAEVGKAEEIFGFHFDVAFGDFDGGVEIALRLMAHGEAGERVAAARVEFQGLVVERDRIVVIAVGVVIDGFVAQFLGLHLWIFVIGHRIPRAGSAEAEPDGSIYQREWTKAQFRSDAAGSAGGRFHPANWSRRVLASMRSAVSKPSVNQL